MRSLLERDRNCFYLKFYYNEQNPKLKLCKIYPIGLDDSSILVKSYLFAF